MNLKRLSLVLSQSALLASGALASAAQAAACPHPLTETNRPVAPRAATAAHASFIDPTAEVSAEFVFVSEQVYVAPFAKLESQSARDSICIEHASNVQDNTLIKVNGGPAHLGVHSIMAHGSQLVGDGSAVSIARHPEHVAAHGATPSYAGFDAACTVQPPPRRDPSGMPLPPDHHSFINAEERGRQALGIALVDFAALPGGRKFECGEVPAFMSFNTLNHSHVEDGALLSAASRLMPGVTLRGGYATHVGKSLNTQQEADTAHPSDFVNFKVRYVNAGDIAFMAAVLHVNECLAKGYTMQVRDSARAIHPFGGPDSVRGIGIDPGSYHRCEFNDVSERPTIGYAPGADLEVRNPALAVQDPTPAKKIRIIGDVRIALDGASGNRPVFEIEKMNDQVSIRADEGEPFTLRDGIEFGFANTFHALEKEAEDPNREVRVQRGVKFEERVVVHGGGRRVAAGGFGEETTRIGEFAFIGKEAIVFRADIEPRTQVGARAVLAGYTNCTHPRLPNDNDPDHPCHEATPPAGWVGQWPPQPEVIPDRCVKLSTTARNRCEYFVEW